MEQQNGCGPVTLDLMAFVYDAQNWYRGRGNDLASFPGWHNNLTRVMLALATPRRTFRSFRISDNREAHRFERGVAQDGFHLVIALEGQYLGFILHDEGNAIVGAGIADLANNGKTLLRLTYEQEMVDAQIDVCAMNSPLMSEKRLLEFLNDPGNPLLPERPGCAPECLVDLRHALTLHTYALVRDSVDMTHQPSTVNSALEGIHGLITQRSPAACLSFANPFEARVASFLLGDESLTFLVGIATGSLGIDTFDARTLRTGYSEIDSLLIASSDPRLTTTLRSNVKRCLQEIGVRIDAGRQ